MSATKSTDAADALWDFCVQVYGAPGTADACLTLQDRHGADVPLLLAALWSAVEGPGVLGPDDLAALDRHLAPWRDNVVRPLRSVRRWMKGAGPDAEALRERIKADELAAERRALDLAADWLAQRPPSACGVDAVPLALGTYLHWLGCGPVELGPLVAAVQRRSR